MEGRGGGWKGEGVGEREREWVEGRGGGEEGVGWRGWSEVVGRRWGVYQQGKETELY